MTDLIEGVDLSHYQPGFDYSIDPAKFGIIKMGGANLPELYVENTYASLVDRTRTFGREVGHYFFNGQAASPLACAEFFVSNLHDYQPGDAIVIDVENEGTSTPAWGPAEVNIFVTYIRNKLGVFTGVYLNESLMQGSDWSSTVKLNTWLWIAFPGAAPYNIKWWSEWSMWQYTSIGNVDRNKTPYTLALLSGITKTEWNENEMKYFNCIGYDRMTVDALGWEPLADDETANVMSKYYDGQDIEHREFDVIKQNANIRRESIMAALGVGSATLNDTQVAAIATAIGSSIAQLTAKTIADDITKGSEQK